MLQGTDEWVWLGDPIAPPLQSAPVGRPIADTTCTLLLGHCIKLLVCPKTALTLRRYRD